MKLPLIYHTPLLTLEPLLRAVNDCLDENGYAIVRDYPIDASMIEKSGLAFLDLAGKLGTPVAHDAGGAILWDIKSRLDSSSSVKTYSEHSHEAEMHTDCQYSENPEDCFGLLCLKRSDCGGGESMLLSLADIERELALTENGRRCRHILRTQEFPFIVPTVFKKAHASAPEFVQGFVLRDGKIRYRVDTIEKALAQWPEFDTPDRRFAFEHLRGIVTASEKICRLHLEVGEIIFVNNLTMLHGRTAFSDESRHLVRVRMRRFSPAA